MANSLLNIIVLYSLGNASYEPGSTYDAYARPAALHAPSRHDASSWDGTWSNAPWCYASRSDDAWTDAWTNAPAGVFIAIWKSEEQVDIVSFCSWRLYFHLFLFDTDYLFYPSRSQKILPITSSSSQTCPRRPTSSCCPCSSTSQSQVSFSGFSYAYLSIC